jgi:opacity protein-like surface antigen
MSLLLSGIWQAACFSTERDSQTGNSLRRKTNMSRIFLATITCGVLISIPGLAQEDYTSYKMDGTVQALGSFVKSTTDNGVQEKASKSGGVLGTYRYYFNRHMGVEVNYGYTLNTEKYNGNGVNTNSHEVSAAYVYRFPQKRWSPFVLAGAGGLVFDPKDFKGATTQARAAFVYGGGADFNLTNHLFMRTEYRGFVYNSPTYDYAGYHGFDRTTHRAEPSIGLGWRF